MALGADLGRELALVLEIVGADDAHFLHAIAERLFTVDMFAAVHAPVGDESVGVIRGAADNRLNVLLVEALPPVHILLGAGEFLRSKSQVLLVHVAQGNDILAGEAAEVRFGAAPGADEGNIELVTGGIGAEESGPWKDKAGGSGESDGSEELTSFHWASLTARKHAVKPWSVECLCDSPIVVLVVVIVTEIPKRLITSRGLKLSAATGKPGDTTEDESPLGKCPVIFRPYILQGA